jgi:hypothetical protein
LYLNSGIVHDFEWPDRAIKPEWKGLGNVVGCGITIDRNGKLSLFFTLNGILLGKFCGRIGLKRKILQFAI